MNRIFTGDCRDTMRALIADGVKVNMVVTSPPYWGLRNYGIPPLIWGGISFCEHEWHDEGTAVRTGGTESSTLAHYDNGLDAEAIEEKVKRSSFNASKGATCWTCGAWRGDLGLEPTPWAYVAHIVEVFDLVRQLLADDGTLWLNIGDCYASDGGMLTPHGGLPKNRRVTQDTVSGANRWRAGMETEVRAEHGGEYRALFSGVKPKDMIGMPWALGIALRAAGWYLRSDIIWHKQNPMPGSYKDRPTTAHEYLLLLSKNGNRPLWWQAKDTFEWSQAPNHDETVISTTNKVVPRWLGFDYYYDWNAISEQCSDNTHARLAQDVMRQRGSDRAHEGVRRNGRAMKAVAPAGPKDAGREDQGLRKSMDLGRGAGWRKPGVTPKAADLGRESGVRSNATFHENHSGMVERRNKRTVWTLTSEGFKGAHFATFPRKLVEPCILAGSRPGGIVFDLFMGSGTTAEVASRLGRQYIGCELGEKNESLQRQRVAQPGLVLA